PDAGEIAAAQIKGVPRADAVSPDIPRPLSDVVARCMATDASKRYQTVDELGLALDEVEQILERQRRPSVRELIRQWTTRVAVGVPAAIVALGLLGFLTSMQFNFVFGRDGEFARFGVESWGDYLLWGVRFAVPILVVMTMTAAVVAGAMFALRILTLIGPIGRVAGRLGPPVERVEMALGLNKSAKLAQTLVGLGVVTLALFIWSHAGLIRAWLSFFNSSPIDVLMPMTDSAPERNEFHNQLTVPTLAFSFGLYKVMARRAHDRLREGRSSVVMLSAVIALMVVLNALPWRTLNRRDFPRLDTAGAHCYITGT